MEKWLSDDSRVLFEALVPSFTGPSRLDRMVGLAELMQGKGLLADAARLSRKVLAESRGQSLASQRARRLLGANIPDWHYSILQDQVRLEAYERAIRATVTPGSLVLDIGTGSGILAMMAARAGAGLVVACERDPAVAQVATKIVARNNLSDRIRIVACASSALRVGGELPRRAEVVISELFSATLLGESVLPTMAQARRELLTADAPAVPRRATIHVALVRAEKRFHKPVGMVAGFDLLDFNVLGPPFHVCGHASPEALLSDAAELFSLDLTGCDPVSDARASVELRVSRAGAAVGVLQWWEGELSEGVILSTAPGAPSTSWGQCFTPFDESLPVVAGQTVTVHGWHSSDQLAVWV